MVGEKLIIFGMGNVFKRRIKQFDLTKIVAVTDNHVSSDGEENSGLKIIKPEEIRTLEFDFIVICTGYAIAKEIYSQLTEVLGIPGIKIISEKKYFEKVSWEPITLLDICSKLGIHSITNTKKYFYSNGILSNTNVFGENFADISWTDRGQGIAILLGEVCDKASYENIFDKFKIENYKFNNNYKFIMVINNTCGQERLKAKSMLGYSLNYISGLDLQLIVYQKQDKCSIYVATHKDYNAPTSDLYITLWLSNKECTNTSYLREHGDNISYLNFKINECTGLYWLWKHANEEIVGLNHYRRYFKLNNSNEILSEVELRSLIEEYDILVGNAVCTYPMTNSRYLENSIDEKAFNKAKQLVQEAIMKLQPDYVECFIEVMDGYAFFPCNMFITTKVIFDRYCEWLFSIIIPAAEGFDEIPYDDYSKRAIGFFAERLLTVWLYKNEYRIKELPILLKDVTM
ncbi:DUF4422 domain-containing protein [Lacrimispora xylanolytica]|uniref:DUF4422 domain-containing protein n=1 Tax=Lacrimispora xylanolytica TaxID=29375 RepID=A0ABY7ACL8_9FIRM|nr:DUF4422 domain-containing protein [Lacrimispora xylanolytica]WAJ24100.1 DUF4422 domain-containing protein [Lacrimispora xylanolytica]